MALVETERSIINGVGVYLEVESYWWIKCNDNILSIGLGENTISEMVRSRIESRKCRGKDYCG